MAKNNAYINQVKQISRYFRGDQMVVDSMAAFALTLRRYTNMGNDDVLELLAHLQHEWNESVHKGYNIADYCLSEYGIDVRGKNDDKK